jgi:hypothetical protein
MSSVVVRRHRLRLLLGAYSGVLCFGMWVAVMFVGGGAARRILGVLLPGNNLQYSCVLRKSCLPPTGTTPSDPGRESRELSLEVEMDGAWALLGL